MQENPTYNIPITPVVPESPVGVTAQATPAPKNKNIYMVVIALLVVIVLALMSLAVYLVMTNLDEMNNKEEIATNSTTKEPTEESSLVTPSEISPTEGEEGVYTDFSFPVFISLVRDKNDPYIVSGKALSDAELLPSEDEDDANFVIKGEGYELSVNAFYESEASAYSDFVLIDTVGEEKIARVRDDYSVMQENEYKYVRSTTLSDTNDCQGMGPDLLPAPCGSSHYVSGNEVETFYILNIQCFADEEQISKCDDIVKSLRIEY